MKDEEMAEEYANKYGQDAFTQAHMPEMIDCIRMERKQSFLAGLKAGRPQWHDLREDPKDLPKKKQECLCKINYYESEEVFNGCLTYSPKLKGFYLDSDEETEKALFKITAWCEIPTFDKE